MKNKHNWHPQILVQAATAKAATALAGAVGKRDVECTGQLTDEEVAEIARELGESKSKKTVAQAHVCFNFLPAGYIK